MADAREHELVGYTLGPYRIDKLLGQGAMGDVFRATHVALGRPVALKTLKPEVAANQTLTERFFAEARAANIIRHENIIECTDLVFDPSGRSYIVMELLEGKTLGAAAHEVGRMPARRVAHICAQIADAIGAAHAAGIVHRDLKPENVYLIRRAGSPDYVKVLDFGIARLRPDLGGAMATQTGVIMGTPAYMAPEQVRGEKAGPAVDIYALGVILFQMLAGRLPFETQVMSMMLVAHLSEQPARLESLVPDVPPALADLVARCLAKAPGDRPRDMATVRRTLLVSVGLPVDDEPTASASLPVAVSAPAFPAVAPVPPTHPPPAIGHAPVSQPPFAVGRSSVSSGAAELVGGPPRKPAARHALIGGGIAAAVIATIVIVKVAGSGSTTTETPREPGADPAKPEPPKPPVTITELPSEPSPPPAPTNVDPPIEAKPAPAKTAGEPPVAAKTMYSVKVSSIPAGASIVLNGKSVGVTPTTIKLPAGELAMVTLQRSGYKPETQRVTPKTNNQSIYVMLKKQPVVSAVEPDDDEPLGDGDVGAPGGVIGGVSGDSPPPPPPPPPPAPPQNVPPTLLEGQRISGDRFVVPDDTTKTEIQRSGKDKVVGSYKMCINIDGNVATVVQLKGTGFAAYDAKIVTEMRAWKYRPYMVNGKAVPVCTAVTFIYSQK